MIDGTYAVVVKSPLGDQESTVTIKTDGDTFTGSNVGAMASMDIEGRVSGNTLTWQQKMKVPMPMTLDMTATIDGDEVTGTVKAGMFGTFPLTSKRTG